MKKVFPFLLFLILLFTSTGFLIAAPISPEDVPGPLKPWIEWVLHGFEEKRCPSLYGAGDQHRCDWPSDLKLRLTETGGVFRLNWLIVSEGWAALPGSAKHWPQEVRVDDQRALVADRDGRPAVYLDPGDHTVSGVFEWESLPESLQIPPDTGIVELTINKKTIDFPRVDSQGALLLREQVAGGEVQEEEKKERIGLRVHRRIVDDIPLTVITRIDLNVSGRPREALLGRTLIEGYMPLSLSSPLPARLEVDGRLRVQVKPGRWTILLMARHKGPVHEISLSPTEGPWPKEEVWVFDARNHLRLVTIEDVTQIDPRQTTLPPEWQRFPAYRVQPGDTLRIVEKRRGDPDPAPDQLALHRSLWLDFKGEGYTIQDRLTGTMTRGWRLEMNAPIELGRVLVDGQPQFITRIGESERAGVEVRRGQIQLLADSRIAERPSRLPAVGWDHDFHQVQGTLNLPPGWRLLDATGVDQIPNTWLKQWTLLDLFLLLIIALAIAKLWKWPWGIAALATLVVIYHEPGAPKWVWLHLLGAIALLKVLQTGRLRNLVQAYRTVSMVVLIAFTVPFMVIQVRQGLFPQLEKPWRVIARGAAGVPEEPALQQRLEIEGTLEEEFADRATPEKESYYKVPSTVTREKRYRSRLDLSQMAQVDPNANIQTGPGLPVWQWRSIPMRWNGPVERDQEIRFIFLSPGVNTVLAFLRVVLLAILVIRVLDIRYTRGSGLGFEFFRTAARTTGGIMLVFSLLSFPGHAQAGIPSPELLNELRARLLEKPECAPNCATSPRLRLEVAANILRARMEVHAYADVGVPLPGRLQQWLPHIVLLNGEPAQGLFRGPAGHLWIALSTGRHQILMEGPLPNRDTVQIPLPLKSHAVEAIAEGWLVEGLHEDGVADDNLQLRRLDENKRKKLEATLEPGTLPPFVRVERTLLLGLTWQAETRVLRASPSGTAIVLEIPLLDGESVTSADVRVEQDRALINMAPQQAQVSWVSVVEKKSEVALRASDTTSWTEIWRLNVSPIWHAELEGIPVIHHQGQAGQWLPEWRPWPNETITLNITRPEGIPGKTVTVDSSRLLISPGLRATDTTLGLSLRSSRGGQHSVTLPENARLQLVKINGKSQPIRQEGRVVTLPLTPGAQFMELQWRQSDGIASRFKTPAVDVGIENVNTQVQVRMPGRRWVLFTGGPQLGPAVLFWPFVIVILLVAAGLGRVTVTPLKTYHWILLGLGLTQARIEIAMLVVAWLLILGYRKRLDKETGNAVFNLAQLGLVILSALALFSLIYAIRHGLLGRPEMWIMGNASNNYFLQWFQDRSEAAVPQAWIFSVHILFYRIAMLAWALWLALAMLRWLRWGWDCFSHNGIWRPITLIKPKKKVKKGKEDSLELDVEE
ncbi:MAG: hypothetical protein GTN74_02615 [Proteobacteria bacterium]|nr:hypothetical protein [Pseudomonadota bacterium]NIS68070.1 hypothetical protein [Pseudomonadota bacterium]